MFGPTKPSPRSKTEFQAVGKLKTIMRKLYLIECVRNYETAISAWRKEVGKIYKEYVWLSSWLEVGRIMALILLTISNLVSPERVAILRDIFDKLN